jgi:hypothetical protein
MFELLDLYRWPNDGIPFAGLDLRMDDLASRLGIDVHVWNDDGLGQARGLAFRSSSGRVYLLEELDVAVRYYGATGPGVYVDAADLATVSLDTLVDDVVAALGIARHEVVWVADESLRQSAAAFVAKLSAERANRALSVAATVREGEGLGGVDGR